ncbi:hypothetical protein ACFLR3_02895 [Campylobacterota bacterium]
MIQKTKIFLTGSDYGLLGDNGIEVLTESVDNTQEEIDTVIQTIGIDYIQGYYFSRPTAEPIRKL